MAMRTVLADDEMTLSIANKNKDSPSLVQTLCLTQSVSKKCMPQLHKKTRRSSCGEVGYHANAPKVWPLQFSTYRRAMGARHNFEEEVMMMRQAFILAALVVVGAMPAYAAADVELKTVDRACWAEIFEDTDFDLADPHVKIQGPMEMASLKDFSGRNWSNEIESIIVGPNAEITAYPDKNFQGTELVLKPNKRINDLSQLNMSDDIESMKISCGG